MIQPSQILGFYALAARLDEGASLLTVNNRLTRQLSARYSQLKIEQGSVTWATPKILPLHSWLQQIWATQIATHQHQPAQLMPDWRARQIWQQIIDNSDHQLPLANVMALAQQAYQGWQLCQRWQVPYSELQNQGTDPRFISWSKLYDKHLTNCNLIDNSQICTQINKNIPQLVNLNEAFYLVGFDALTPDISQLMHSVDKLGEMKPLMLSTQPGNASRRGFDIPEQELRAAADWAAQKREADPHARIGIVVPQLNEIRHCLQSEFARVLAPAALPLYDAWESMPFNLSQGTALFDEPLISLAFAIFELTQSPVSILTLSGVLGSPHLAGYEQEHSARSQLDRCLRELNQRRVPHKLVQRYGREQQSATAPLAIWQEHWQAFCGKLAPVHRQGDTAQHATALWALLQQLGWAEGKSLSSREYQARQQFVQLLEEYSALAPAEDPHSVSQAIIRLRQEAKSRVFQAETGDTPIQIMGLLEATELQFDCVWVMQMDHHRWPLTPAPHALIPLALQKKYRMPRTDHDRELEYAQTITARLKDLAPEVIFSYSSDDVALPARPSKLIESLPMNTQASKAAPSRECDSAPPMEMFEDDYGLPLISANTPGGAQFLNLQGQCAFRAYAAHRLDAKPLPEPAPGRLPWERGQLVHGALEHIWSQLKDSDSLQAQDSEALQQLVHKAVANAQAKLSAHRPLELTPAINDIEQSQVQRMLLTWLELEQQRQPFKVIAIECEQQIQLETLNFRLRLDRMDETPQGHRFIIDYKTGGQGGSAGWTKNPVQEVQLPLYALSQPKQLSALLLAKLTSAEQKFEGISAISEPVSGIKPYQGRANQPEDWQALLAHWQHSLSLLAKQAASGYARVAPQSYQTCRYCAYPSLCRIRELTDLTHDANE